MINNGKTEIESISRSALLKHRPALLHILFYPPTPANNETFTISVGDHLTFDVKAQDDDNGSTVTLTEVGYRQGQITNP